MQCVNIYIENSNVRKSVQYIVTEKDCWHVISHTKSIDGYVKVKRNTKPYLLHRWVYEQEKGTIPEGMVIMHSCDNPSCINPNHLSIGTQGENNADRHSKGRSKAAHGTNNGNSRLTEEQYKMIMSSPKGCTTLAKELGVHEQSIVTYRKRHNYKREKCI